MVSVRVSISIELMKSVASTHLDNRLLQFQVPSQTTLLLVLCDLNGTVDHFVESADSTSRRIEGEALMVDDESPAQVRRSVGDGGSNRAIELASISGSVANDSVGSMLTIIALLSAC